MRKVINEKRLLSYLEKEKDFLCEQNSKIIKSMSAGDIFRDNAYSAFNEYNSHRNVKNFAKYEKLRNDAMSQYKIAAKMILSIDQLAGQTSKNFINFDIDIDDEKQVLYLVDEYVEAIA